MRNVKNLTLCVLMLALVSSAAADTHYVSSGESIQDAIDSADPGDEIEVAPWTYLEAINFSGKDVRLYSSGGPGVTTIDGTGHYHVVQCVSGEGSGTILEGFTITGGNANGTGVDLGGGGMLNDNSSPTVTNCTFSGNSAEAGGGMDNENSSSPTVTNCSFTSNTASGGGGGMRNAYSSNPTVTNCTFTTNSADLHGGGLVNVLSSSPTLTNCVFSGNEAVSGHGGGMINSVDCSPEITNCTFSGNTAGDDGGGMFNNDNSNPAVTNCTFIYNSAGEGGGMFNNKNSYPFVTNCTFTSNTGTYVGGGICNDSSSSPTVTNCILWGDTGDEILGLATVAYCDVQGGWAGTGNIDADPMFADADGRLLAGSPCIDAGDNSVVTVTTDLDGNHRIVGLAVDMGAYEFQEPLQHAAAKTQQLIDKLVALELPAGIEKSLVSKLKNAIDSIQKAQEKAAVNKLEAFINEVEAQRGKKIPEADADALIALVQEIIEILEAG